MMEFDLKDGGKVRLDPAGVESVAEHDVRTRNGEMVIAEVVMRSGARYLVYDPERVAGAAIFEAAAQAYAQRLGASERIAKALEALGLAGIQ